MEREQSLTDIFGEAPYQMIVRQLEDIAVFHLDLEGQIQSWNRGAANLFGYTAGEAIGGEFAMLFTHEDRLNGVPEREMKKAAESGQAQDVRWHQCKDGTTFYANGVTTALRDEMGTLSGYAKVARDDTARRQAEVSLQASEVRFRRLFEAAYDGILILNAETGQITDVNPYLCRLLEYQRQEFLGKELWEIGLFKDKDASQKAFQELQEKGYIRYEGLPLETKGGLRREVEFISNLYPENGHDVIQCNIRDINDRKLSEEKLRASEERFHALVTTSSDVVYRMSPDWSQLHPLHGRDFLATTHQPSNIWLEEYISVEDQPQVMAVINEAIRNKSIFELEHRVRRVDGSLGWTHSRAVPLLDGKGQIVEWLGTASDITGRKQQEEELVQLLALTKQAQTAAEGANHLKDEFLATLSHELRTPLNSIVGWAAMLANPQFDSINFPRAVETIRRNAQMQAQMIEDLLDVSSIITGKLRLTIQPVDLGSIILAAVDVVRPAAEAKEIRLQLQLDSPSGQVFGDPDRLQQVCWNLISNSIKFTPKGGRVIVRLERIESHLEITISDTGNGIEPDFLPHVFDRFRQANSTSTRVYGGLGLGLAIVRQLVELHGGTVRVESAGAGMGASFTVNLPLAAVSSATPDANQPARQHQTTLPEFVCPPELAGVRVLIVDDEADTRELLQFILEGCGSRVTTASSAAAALEAIKTETFDVLVSDIGMPEEDGFSLIAKVRALDQERGGQIPAAALTAYAREQDRIRVLSSGFQIHLPKPISPNELMAVVANLANRTKDNRLKEEK